MVEVANAVNTVQRMTMTTGGMVVIKEVKAISLTGNRAVKITATRTNAVPINNVLASGQKLILAVETTRMATKTKKETATVLRLDR